MVSLTSSVHREISVGSTVGEHGAVAPPRRPVAPRPLALHRSPTPAHQHTSPARGPTSTEYSRRRLTLGARHTTHVNSPMMAGPQKGHRANGRCAAHPTRASLTLPIFSVLAHRHDTGVGNYRVADCESLFITQSF